MEVDDVIDILFDFKIFFINYYSFWFFGI